MAATPSTERHLYSVPIPITSSGPDEKIPEPQALTDVTKSSFYGSNFSPEAGFYVLNYQGPSTPWTKVLDTDKLGAFWELLFVTILLVIGCCALCGAGVLAIFC
jgi:hypothetical protein